MKKGKKIVIGIVAAAVVAGGVYLVTGGTGGEAQLPQVSVTKAETGDVEEIVDATGTVVSDEQKTFYSPVNAQVKKVSFADGDSVSEGTKLVEFELKDLERDNKKAELNVKSGEYDYKNSINKSNQADQKQKDAKSKVATLEQQVKDKQNYLASLKSQLSAVQSQAAADAQAAAQAQAAQAAAEAQAKADAQAQAEAESQRAYADALNTYQTKTLPAYQKELGELNTAYIKAQGVYNQADTAYQMAFAQWQADPSDENAQALDDAEAARSQAEIDSQQAKEAYENKKAD